MSGKRMKGYSFIKYASRQEAEAAVEAMHGKDFEGRDLKVNFSSGQATEKEKKKQDTKENNQEGESKSKVVFVGNMSYNSDEASIKSFFASCGTVLGVRIALQDDGKKKGFCHVEFDTPEEA